MSGLQTCTQCHQAKPWQRFRIRVGNGTTKESNLCSDCRSAITRAAAAKRAHEQKRLERQLVLLRTGKSLPSGAKKPVITPKMEYLLNRNDGESFKDYQRRKELGYPYYYPKVEKMLRTYANKQTAMDRKYLRDNEHLPLHPRPYTAQQQRTAREHAKGWIGFYDDLLNHAINLLRQTGKRPTWAQLEASADLQKLYGIYDTKRAAVLRSKG